MRQRAAGCASNASERHLGGAPIAQVKMPSMAEQLKEPLNVWEIVEFGLDNQVAKLLTLALNARLHQDGAPTATVDVPKPPGNSPHGPAHHDVLAPAHGPTGYRASHRAAATGMNLGETWGVRVPEDEGVSNPTAVKKTDLGSASLVKGKALFKGVIWDVDGTLVEFTRYGYLMTNGVLKANGYPLITEQQYKEGTKFPTPERFAFHISGDTTDAAGPELARQFDHSYTTHVEEAGDVARLFPGVKELLDDLKAAGVSLAVFSNACGKYVRAVMKSLSIESDFVYELGADEAGVGKPAPDGLLQICSSMGLRLEDCIYIGDSPTDGTAASAAGMQGVGVAWGASDADTLAHKFPEVVGTVQELRAVLFDKDAK